MLTRYRFPQTARAQFSRDPFFHFVDRFFNDFGSHLEPSATGTLTADSAPSWTPAMDVTETEDAFVTTADLPGMSKDDIQISLDEGVLSISGERKLERTSSEDGAHFRRFERASGSFHRSFTLPQGIDQEKVSASFDNGVLALTLPKSELAKSRTISIS